MYTKIDLFSITSMIVTSKKGFSGMYIGYAVNKSLSFQRRSSNFFKTKFADNQSPNIGMRSINYLARESE